MTQLEVSRRMDFSEELLRHGVFVELRNGLSVLVRKLRRSDGERIYRFVNNLSPHSRNMFHPYPFDRYIAERAAAEANSRSSFRLVALHSNDIVGYAYWRQRTLRPHFPVVSIAVADAFQNQGLGRYLLRLLIEAAKRRAKRGLELAVFKNNSRAIHLYESLGFRVVGETADRRQYVMRLEFPRRKHKRKRTFKFRFWFWGGG